MLALLTNDDGIFAPGLAAMERALAGLGEVVAVAPATEQSGVGHAITFLTPLTAKQVYDGDRCRGWAVDGSPADAVKLGVTQFLPRRPDLVVSGINSGLNAGINVRPDLPTPIVELYYRMMEKHPGARPQSAQEVADTLAAWLASAPCCTARPPRGASSTSTSPPRRCGAGRNCASCPWAPRGTARPTSAASTRAGAPTGGRRTSPPLPRRRMRPTSRRWPPATSRSRP